jgi:hypothetical protein
MPYAEATTTNHKRTTIDTNEHSGCDCCRLLSVHGIVAAETACVSSGVASGLHSTGCVCAAMHDPMPRTDHLAQAMPPEAAPLEAVTNAKRVCAAHGGGSAGDRWRGTDEERARGRRSQSRCRCGSAGRLSRSACASSSALAGPILTAHVAVGSAAPLRIASHRRNDDALDG